MKYENKGLTVWFGTPDAEAPSGRVAPGQALSIVIGVSPPDAGHRVWVHYRVDGGELRKIAAQWMRSDATGKAQYFRALFPELKPGNHVEYAVVCECDGKRVPETHDGQFPASFTVEEETSGVPEFMPLSERTAKIINLPAPDSNPPSDGDVYQVDGKVVSRSSAGVGRLRILIVDKNVGGDIGLAETYTDLDGFYQATFKGDSLRARNKPQPDLQARVFSSETKALLGASDVRYKASQHETLNVLLEESVAQNLKSEHEVLLTALASEFSGRLSELKENDKQQDITYLANKTGWDARAVALAALADQFSARTSDANGAAVPQSFFYALFRAGLPPNENTLFQTEAATLKSVWQTAMNQGVIPQVSGEQITSLINRFQSLSAQTLLTAPALVGTSSLSQILTVSRLMDFEQKKFAEIYAANSSNPMELWKAVTAAFGVDTSNRLQVNGKLAFLTINNGDLMQKIHRTAATEQITDPVELAQTGFHKAQAWQQLLTAEVPVPNEIPGDTPEIKRMNYANYLAAQVRLSYPTASMAHLVKSGELRFRNVAEDVSSQVHEFLTENQGKFEIGVHPVERYIADNKLSVNEKVLEPLLRLQRTYQITASDQALIGLAQRGIDSARQVVSHDRETFVRSFAETLGGSDQAALTYDRSVQVHHAVLNIALAYINSRTAPGIGVHSPPSVIDPAHGNTGDVIAYPTLERLLGSTDFCACDHCRSILSPAAYLVDLLLFLPADVSEWEVVKSDWRAHHNAPYPFPDEATWIAAGRPTDTETSPRDVLLSRRPDVQHLPLTCENTNTVLPYIDVVNETLEYFVANAAVNLSQTPPRLPLDGFKGHDSNGVASEDLLASPQFVIDTAYNTLRAERFPFPLPFHQPLENLRRYFLKFESPLSGVMEQFRGSNDLERGANEYGWRDVWMEEIGLSRSEYEILTDSRAVRLSESYGFPTATADDDVIGQLSNAKKFARRLHLTYEEIVAILRTRFVNPNSDLISKLERLGVSFAQLQALKDGTITDADFDRLLPTEVLAPDPAEYDGDIKAWVRRQDNFDRLMGIITLTDLSGGSESCSFDHVEFRYSKPATDVSTRLNAVAFIRLLRFIRLWKKLGWTIEQTDAALCALYRTDLRALDTTDLDTAAKLDAGFSNVLPRLGIISRVMATLNLTPKRDLLRLLACFGQIGTHDGAAWTIQGEQRLLQIVPSLYRQLFLTPAILVQDAVFADNGYGEFLQRAEVNYTHPQPTLEQPIVDAGHGNIGYNNSTHRLSFAGILDGATRRAVKAVAEVSADFQHAVDDLYRVQRQVTHVEALRSAFNLTADEYDLIATSLGYDDDTPLTLKNISAVFRHGWLARKLKLSVRELLLLIQLTGLDPFAPPDLTSPAILKLIELIQLLKDRSLKSAVALYLIWNQDLSGRSEPNANDVLGIVRTLRLALAAIETDFAVVDDPDGSVAQARFARVYGTDVAAFFFGLLNNTLSVEVEYSDQEGAFAVPTLTAIETAAGQTDSGAPKISYDDFRKKLSYAGVLTTATRDAIKSAAGAAAVRFNAAIDELFNRNQAIINPSFARYPELQSAYETYAADTVHTAAEKRNNLLKATLPELVQRRKRQEVLQSTSALANTDLVFAQMLLDPLAGSFPLHAAGHVDQPALNDLLAIETQGLSVQFFASNTASGAPIPASEIAANLDYAPLVAGVGNPLPSNPTSGNPISGIWTGYLEAPENGFFKFRIETEAGATVTLTLNDVPVTLAADGAVIVNANPVELSAGNVYPITLTVENVRDVMRVLWEWQPKGQGRAVVAARYLYPATRVATFKDIYVRFLKVASLATALGLTANELTWFATSDDYHINTHGQLDPTGDGWLNFLSSADNLHLTDPIAAGVARNLNASLTTPLLDLLDFARIKAEISPGAETLLELLKDPTKTIQNQNNLLFTSARWNQVSLNEVLARFGGNIAGLQHFNLFRRVYDSFAVIQRLGISASALLPAITNEPTGDTVRNLQAALRARYDSASWRDVIQPLNDEMRGLQRNALVAYILHLLGSRDESSHIDTPDKLFEYFLMDVQMEPCMQTSRIRHALSSIQLFIERCLMNLEPRVTPAVFTDERRKQWEWMKRYRVWEANRKVYLFPENWLEPELRDDQSPFFKEALSELLQSDITAERATAALLNYLSKLSTVAKLEPCGMYHIPPNGDISEIDHVIARTSGAQRHYYYRRYEYGYWTPWEEIKLGIEDDPVIPVVWNNRLLLFWLRVLKQQSDQRRDPFTTSPGAESDPPLTALRPSNINTTSPDVAVSAMLCWSEYYNGKWQSMKTSDVDLPAYITDAGAVGFNVFNRKDLRLSLAADDSSLQVSLDHGTLSKASFKLLNTHSLPLVAEAWQRPAIDYRTISTWISIDIRTGRGSRPLLLTYFSGGHGRPGFTHYDRTLRRNVILLPDDNIRVAEPRHPLAKPFEPPFFYADSQHVFLVRSKLEPFLIFNATNFGVLVKPSVTQVLGVPPLVVDIDPRIEIVSKFPDGVGPIGPDPAVINPDPIRRFVSDDAFISRGIGTSGSVTFGDREIGPAGAIPAIKNRF
jgi:hypothetical protein